MRIYLIRHGQTTGDVEDRYGGDYEDNLTKEGIRQAEELANQLADRKIEIIFSSPRIRAQETADILSRKFVAKKLILEDIRERNHYGILTGMTKDEAGEKYPDQVKLLKNTKNTILGGEDYIIFGNRVKKTFEAILNSDYQTVTIVSHGGPIRFIFREILRVGEIKIGDCALAGRLVFSCASHNSIFLVNSSPNFGSQIKTSNCNAFVIAGAANKMSKP